MEDPVIAFESIRMWMGEEPLLFFVEIIFRSVLSYIYCFALLRVLSGRAVAQMSLLDFVLIIALGSAVGDVAFYADVPILHALMVITVIITITKLLDRWIHNWAPLKSIFDNSPTTLVHEGIINQAGSSRRDMNEMEVMERLRLHGIRNLGEVEWAFVEANGNLSVFRYQSPKPGLLIVPPHDLVPRRPNFPSPAEDEPHCCLCCGMVISRPSPDIQHCPNCNGAKWTLPTLSVPS
ncbi:DUF421 domain-containing protein [Falsochrobactrum shanghaiense]|nr:YetF domain-containing protein [Falsochrobactrum shanghaiense]